MHTASGSVNCDSETNGNRHADDEAPAKPARFWPNKGGVSRIERNARVVQWFYSAAAERESPETGSDDDE